MLHLDQNRRYYVYLAPADMRKGFDSLCGLVRATMQQNPMNGDVYIFFNRSRTHVKLLLWEHDRYSLYYKRLERGTYELPGPSSGGSMGVTSYTLSLILQGVELSSVRHKKRYARVA